ncbi:hypothetical protein [Microbacterium resistens]|nr:hypothetical protein [Streptomyces sp. MS2A]
MADEWTQRDEAEFYFTALEASHPVKRASVFFMMVLRGDFDADVVGSFVTPESRPAWGDFSAARGSFESIGSPGIGSHARPAEGAPDVVYVKVLDSVHEAHLVTTPTPVVVPGVFTMIWRPEVGAWLIHSFGDYLLPEVVPRTSPGSAPSVE